MRNKFLILLFLASLLFSPSGRASPQPKVRAGTFVKIYDPSVSSEERWYINDHTFIRAEDGVWHMFGITHAEPADALNEIHFAHATAPRLLGPWTKQKFAMTASPAHKESQLWAPYVLFHHGLYYMYYCAGAPNEDHAHYRIHLATSRDLFHWRRSRHNPMIVDGFDARDPFVLHMGHQWILYYTATSTPTGGKHIISYRVSDDLVHWRKQGDGIAFTHPDRGTEGGPTESPFVLEHNNKYYLFIGPKDGYRNTPQGYIGTEVYESDTPFKFALNNWVGSIPAHALEVVQDENGNLFVSHSGWNQGGLYLAPLEWF